MKNLNFLKIKIITCVCLFIVFSLFTTSCNKDEKTETAQYLKNINDADGSLKKIIGSKVLRVGSDISTGLPFVTKNAGKYDGFEIEIAHYVASQLGCKLKVVPNEWDKLLVDLEKDKYDIVINAIEKPVDKTSNNSGFSKSYFTNSQNIVVQKSNNSIKRLQDLNNKKVGVINNSESKILITELNQSHKAKINLLMYPNIKDQFSSLDKNFVDAILIDTSIASWICSNDKNNCKIVGNSFLPRNYVIAVNKENRALLNGIDAILKNAKKTGEITKILKNWNLVY